MINVLRATMRIRVIGRAKMVESRSEDIGNFQLALIANSAPAPFSARVFNGARMHRPLTSVVFSHAIALPWGSLGPVQL